MLNILSGTPSPRASPRRSPSTPDRTERLKSPERSSETEEVIKLSHYPSAQVKAKDEVAPIEREDWPAPPATAVVSKNLG